MYLKKIMVVKYHPSHKKDLINALHYSLEPIVIDFGDKFKDIDLDYLKSSKKENIRYYFHEKNSYHSFDGDFSQILSSIQANAPNRIFGKQLEDEKNREILSRIPFLEGIKKRARYFKRSVQTLYFFGGKGTYTSMHYDRELNTNLHLCLFGKKRVLLSTYANSKFVYKTPFISDSLIRFSDSNTVNTEKYPLLENAVFYDTVIQSGQLLYIPKRCWHYIEYIEPNASLTFSYYPRLIDNFIGFFTGLFYLGFSKITLGIDKNFLFEKYAHRYTQATGIYRWIYRAIEFLFYLILFPICVLSFLISMLFRKYLY